MGDSILDHLPIETKSKVVDLIIQLRLASIIGLIESRDWIAKLFPEFAEVRDADSDFLFEQMANLQTGANEGE